MAKRRTKKKSTGWPTNKVLKSSGMVKVEGVCKDCGITWTGGATSIQAVRHFQETGHEIRVDQHTYWERKLKS